MRAGINANSVTRVSGSSAPERAVAARPGDPAGPAGPRSPRGPGSPAAPAGPGSPRSDRRLAPAGPGSPPDRAHPPDRRAPPLRPDPAHLPDRAHLQDRRGPAGPASPRSPCGPAGPGSPAGPAGPCRPAGPGSRGARARRQPGPAPAPRVPRWRRPPGTCRSGGSRRAGQDDSCPTPHRSRRPPRGCRPCRCRSTTPWGPRCPGRGPSWCSSIGRCSVSYLYRTSITSAVSKADTSNDPRQPRRLENRAITQLAYPGIRPPMCEGRVCHRVPRKGIAPHAGFRVALLT